MLHLASVTFTTSFSVYEYKCRTWVRNPPPPQFLWKDYFYELVFFLVHFSKLLGDIIRENRVTFFNKGVTGFDGMETKYVKRFNINSNDNRNIVDYTHVA